MVLWPVRFLLSSCEVSFFCLRGAPFVLVWFVLVVCVVLWLVRFPLFSCEVSLVDL